jgi:hypothetical protein
MGCHRTRTLQHTLLKFETPIARTLPVAGSFCISAQVFLKSQSFSATFPLLSLGSTG